MAPLVGTTIIWLRQALQLFKGTTVPTLLQVLKVFQIDVKHYYAADWANCGDQGIDVRSNQRSNARLLWTDLKRLKKKCPKLLH